MTSRTRIEITVTGRDLYQAYAEAFVPDRALPMPTRFPVNGVYVLHADVSVLGEVEIRFGVDNQVVSTDTPPWQMIGLAVAAVEQALDGAVFENLRAEVHAR